jgi:hypothetical protein
MTTMKFDHTFLLLLQKLQQKVLFSLATNLKDIIIKKIDFHLILSKTIFYKPILVLRIGDDEADTET